MFLFLFAFILICVVFFFSSRRRHTRCLSDWSSDVCSSDLHVQIRPAIIIEVEPCDTEPEITFGIADAGALGDVGEPHAAVVAKQKVRLSWQPARPALHRDSAVLAGLVAPELRQVLQIDLHVTADEEIEIAILVVIREAAARRPPARTESCARGPVAERAIVIVAVELIAAERSDVEVLPSVAVDIRRAHAHAPTGMADAGLVGNVLELQVTEIVIERAPR